MPWIPSAEDAEHFVGDVAGATLGFMLNNVHGAAQGWSLAHNAQIERDDRRRELRRRREIEHENDPDYTVVEDRESNARSHLPSYTSNRHNDYHNSMPRTKKVGKRRYKKKFVGKRKVYKKKYYKKKNYRKKTSFVGHSGPRPTKAFKKKVDKVLDQEQPCGKYLIQNDYGVNITPGNQAYLGVQWKATQELINGAIACFPAVTSASDLPVLELEHASIDMYIKNNTQIDVAVDMYRFIPSKKVVSAIGERPLTVWNAKLAQTIVPGLTTPTVNTYGVTPFDAIGLKSCYKYTRVWQKIFKPGATYSHVISDKTEHTINTLNIQTETDAGTIVFGNRKNLYEEYVFIIRGPPGMSSLAGTFHYGTLGAGTATQGTSGFSIFTVNRYKLRRPANVSAGTKSQTFAYTAYSDAPIIANELTVQENNPLSVGNVY